MKGLVDEQKSIFRSRAKETFREIHGYYNTESRDPPLTQMERRMLDEEIDLSIEDILVSLETIATMNEKELREYQKEIFGQLKEVLVAAGVPVEDLEGILDMNDEELMAWMD